MEKIFNFVLREQAKWNIQIKATTRMRPEMIRKKERRKKN